MPDVPWAEEEIKSLLTVLKQYINAEQDIYYLYNAPLEALKKSFDHLTERVNDNPETNFCLMFVAIGHGVQKEGSMHVVINQFDDKVGYYELFNLQDFNKELAERRNVQGTVIFSTSKVQHDKTKHCGCT